jgi:hypothetical protein
MERFAVFTSRARTADELRRIIAAVFVLFARSPDTKGAPINYLMVSGIPGVMV